MVKNTLSDLNNHLFAQLERLSDEELKGECLETEIKRAEAVTYVAKNIIENANTVLKARKYFSEGMNKNEEKPAMLREPTK